MAILDEYILVSVLSSSSGQELEENNIHITFLQQAVILAL